MNEKDIVLFNEYSLNLQTCGRVTGVLAEPPEINVVVKYTETTKGKLPEYISEEIFDKLVVELKQGLIDKGTLIKTPVKPCSGCGLGSGLMGYENGKYVLKTCHEDCQRLKEYYELRKKYMELFGE